VNRTSCYPCCRLLPRIRAQVPPESAPRSLRNTQSLYMFAAKKTRSRSDALDLVQDVFERALRNRPNVSNDAALRSWLMVVLRNLHIDRIRLAINRRVNVDLEKVPDPEPEGQQVWRCVGMEDVERLTGRLTPGSREVFRLHLYGCPLGSIALRLGISTANVSGRLFRARSQMRAMLLARDGAEGHDNRLPTEEIWDHAVMGRLSRQSRAVATRAVNTMTDAQSR
jgi:RNA polymerase sigma-70 factor (ECF subfamily)